MDAASADYADFRIHCKLPFWYRLKRPAHFKLSLVHRHIAMWAFLQALGILSLSVEFEFIAAISRIPVLPVVLTERTTSLSFGRLAAPGVIASAECAFLMSCQFSLETSLLCRRRLRQPVSTAHLRHSGRWSATRQGVLKCWRTTKRASNSCQPGSAGYPELEFQRIRSVMHFQRERNTQENRESAFLHCHAKCAGAWARPSVGSAQSALPLGQGSIAWAANRRGRRARLASAQLLQKGVLLNFLAAGQASGGDVSGTRNRRNA